MDINLIALCIIYACISIILTADIIHVFIEQKYISMYLLCKIMFLIVEVIVPLALHMKFYFDGTLYPWRVSLDYGSDGIEALLWVAFLVSVGYVFISLGYRNKYKIVIKSKFRRKNSSSSTALKYDLALRYTAIILLVLAVISLFMWTKAYGGITQFIMQANAIRSGVTNVSNQYAFFKHFARIVIICSYMFGVLLVFSKRKRISDIFLLIISVIFSIGFLLASDGRMSAGFYLLSFIAIYMQSRSVMIDKKIELKTIVKLGLMFFLSLLFMLKMDDCTFFIKNGYWYEGSDAQTNTLISSFIYELSFVVKCDQLAIMKADQIGLQLINDLGYGFSAWLPSSLVTSSFPRLWTLNTELSGATSGEYPCGIIAQGYYDIRLFGVILLTFLYGVLIKKMDSIKIKTPYGMTIYAALFYSIIRIISYGMIYDFIQGLFGIFVFFITYYLISSFCILRK